MLQVPVAIGPLLIDPPLINGSGVVDVVNPDEGWNLPVREVAKLGAFVTKTITLRPTAGHPAPVVADDGSGTLFNAVGLRNPGLEQALEQWSNLPAMLGVPVIASITGTGDELARIARAIEDAGWALGLELNLSCPNVAGGLVAADPIEAAARVARVRASVSRLPILAKLSPACGDPAAVARAVVDAGADAVVAGNTMPAVALDATGAPLLGAGPRAGMSGAALHPIAVRLVHEVAAAVDVPVVGLGGVDSPAAARRMLDAGARIVGIGSAAFRDHGVVGRLLEGRE